MNRLQIKDYKFYLLIISNSLCLAFSIMKESRAFTFGYFAAIILIFLKNRTFKIKKLVWFISLLAISIFLVLLTFYFKTDSSLGRILIYKISWCIFKENWLFGIGLGNFKIKYGLYQAEYFANGSYASKELLLADNTYFAFNDYWQFIIETGLCGGLLIVIVFYYVALLIKNALKNKTWIKQLFIIQLLAILIAAFFTHVFEKPLFQFYITLILSSLVFHEYKLPTRNAIYLVLLLMFILFCNYRVQLNEYKSFETFSEAKTLALSGFNSKSLEILDKIYHNYKTDFNYLEFYAGRLKSNGQLHKAIAIYEETKKIRTNSDLLVKLANCYMEVKDFKNAEITYILAINMTPKRFSHRYALLNFYIDTNQCEKALTCGEKIENLPVKISSNKISVILNNTKAKLRLLKLCSTCPECLAKASLRIIN